MTPFYTCDAHVHTSESSRCGRGSGSQMAEAYFRRGYDSIIVADHFLNGNTAADRSACWESQVEVLCAGYEKAAARGKELGLCVLFSWEASFDGNDFLTYGLDREWLLKHPESAKIPIREYMELIRSEGGFLVHAHPFRMAPFVAMIRLRPDWVDAVEVRNYQRTICENHLAEVFAESYSLPATAGSDAHAPDMIPDCVFLTREKISSVTDYIRLVKDRKIILP